MAVLFADPTRARVLLALADGRSLPASVLAGEAGVSAQAASSQLSRLRQAGLIVDERPGRHRYYRLADDRAASVLEALAAAAPTEPIRSLRQGTRAAALRRARTCYDHLAGQFGCQLTQTLLQRQALQATDGIDSSRRRAADPLSTPLAEHPYQLGPNSQPIFAELGVELAGLTSSAAGCRPLLRFCMDWTEQRHHLGGGLGAGVLAAFERAHWISRHRANRSITVTELGRRELAGRIGLKFD